MQNNMSTRFAELVRTVHIYIYKQMNIDVQKSVIPRPGLEPRISCVPGRRANHCTTAAPDFVRQF